VVCVKIASHHLLAVSNIAVGEMTQLGLCFGPNVNLAHSVQRNCCHSGQQNDTFICFTSTKPIMPLLYSTEKLNGEYCLDNLRRGGNILLKCILSTDIYEDVDWIILNQ
jgi:hypothetical protein